MHVLAEVATDPDRLARFQREAELLAALNHSHIAQIHGLVEAGGRLVLRARVKRPLKLSAFQGTSPGQPFASYAEQVRRPVVGFGVRDRWPVSAWVIFGAWSKTSYRSTCRRLAADSRRSRAPCAARHTG